MSTQCGVKMLYFKGRDGFEIFGGLDSLAQMSEGDLFRPRGLFGLGGHNAERRANLRLKQMT